MKERLSYSVRRCGGGSGGGIAGGPVEALAEDVKHAVVDVLGVPGIPELDRRYVEAWNVVSDHDHRTVFAIFALERHSV